MSVSAKLEVADEYEERSTYKLDLSNQRNHDLFKFAPYLQMITDNSGYGVEFNKDDHAFLRFKCLALLDSAHDLIHLKSDQSQDIMEEQEIFKEILVKYDFYFEAEAKILNTLKTSRINLPHYVKTFMLGAGFKDSETETTCESYTNYLKQSILQEIEKMDPLKVEMHHSDNGKRKKDDLTLASQVKTVDAIGQNGEDLTINKFAIESCLIARKSTLYLLATTKKHVIYSIIPEYMVLKLLRSSCPLIEDIENLDNELKISRSCSHPSIRSVLSRTTYDSRQGLLLEMVEGYTINNMIQSKQTKIVEFLKIAREMVYALLVMHSNGIVHGNLTCDHVVLNQETASLKIIGVGSSTNFNNQRTKSLNQALLDKDLHCISPEQTGRINRQVDFRSDFYSLGVIFYRILTGLYPIESSNSFDAINSHIAYEPIPVRDINPNIPIPISELISKLLQKNPEDRYKSTKGIMFDLELMIAEFPSDRDMGSITLSQHDTSQSFSVSQKFCGRSNQCKTLYEVFDKLSPDDLEVAFIMGNAGVGKSELVLEFYKTNIHRGVFCFGKYDYSNSEPYSALMEAFQNFCSDLLMRDKAIIANYKDRIIEAVGDEGKLLLGAMNNLHMIIGEQPVIAECNGQIAKNRFNYVFLKFIKAICSVGAPLIIVLEDLQWLDSASYNFISELITDKSYGKNLILIGTYRESEISNDHMVTCLIQKIKQQNVNLTTIKVANLDEGDINEVLSDSLSCTPFESYPLTALVLKKTNGNPFFTNQLLMSLHEQGLIYPCGNTCKWKWNDTIFDEVDIAESVLELIRKKMLSFDNLTLTALKVMSCLGSSFYLPSVKLIVNSSKGIEGALSTGMIVQYKGSSTLYCFVHDQVKEAVLSLVPKNDNIFLYIGMKLWTLLPAEELDEQIFTVANLLHRAVGSTDEENLKIAEFLARAGEKALSLIAFEAAHQYVDTGIKLLGIDCWKTNYNLTLALYNNMAKSVYGMKKYAKMNDIMITILRNATSSFDLVQIYSLKMTRCNELILFDDATNTAMIILNKIGEKIDQSMYADNIIKSLIEKVKSLLTGKSEEEIIQLKDMTDDANPIMLIYRDLSKSSFFVNLALFIYMSIRMIELTFSHGLSKYSCIGFANLGVILSSRGDRLGHRLGKLALALFKKVGAKEVLPLVYFSVYGSIHHYFAPIHETLTPLSEAIKVSLDTGLLPEMNYLMSLYCSHAFLSGMALVKILNDIDELKTLTPFIPVCFTGINQAVLNLINEDTIKPFDISDGEAHDFRSEKIQHLLKCIDKDAVGRFKILDSEAADGFIFIYNKISYSIYACMMAYLFHKHSLALEQLERIDTMLSKHTFLYPLFSHRYFIFYYGLVSLALARNCKEKNKYIIKAKECISQLRCWSEKSPQNYLNKLHLLEGEYYALCGNDEKATECYEKAILLSKKNGFLQEEGVACERAGMFYLETNSLDTAGMKTILRSYYCYKNWGAKAKLKHLIDLHSFIANEVNGNDLSKDLNELKMSEEDKSCDSMSTMTFLSASKAKKRVRLDAKIH